MASVVLNGNTYTDIGAASGRDLCGQDGYGHTRWLLPMLGDAVIDIGAKRDVCAKAVSDALSYKAQVQAAAAEANTSISGMVTAAKGYRDEAAGHEEDCMAQSQRAAEWAGKMDGPVDGGQFSAKYYAEQARGVSAQVQSAMDQIAGFNGAAFDARLRLVEALTFFSI